MATYDLNRAELNSLLAANHIDPLVRQSIIDYLQDDGFLHDHGSTVQAQEGGTLDFNTQVLLVDSPTATVATDPNLQVIVDLADANLTVTGSDPVLVATGRGDDYVDMTGSSGNDVVMAGSGNDTILGGTGADTIIGGNGNDSLVAGSGGNQLLDGSNRTLDGWGGLGGDHGHHDDDSHPGHGDDHSHGSGGNDTLIGGSGEFDTLLGGGGNDSLIAGSGNHQLLSGGDGDDTLRGGTGDSDTLIGGSGKDILIGGIGSNQLLQGNGGNDTFFAGTGGDTLVGGGGNDTFNVAIANLGGNDTILGGGGHDKVVFDDSVHLATISTSNGVTTVQFGATSQTITISGVEQLVFTDHTIKL